MNRKYQQQYYSSKPSPIYTSALPTTTYNHQQQFRYESSANRHYSPHRYRQPIFDTRGPPASYYNNNKYEYGLSTKSVSSRIGELNDRVQQETNLFKIRTQHKRNHAIRSSSTQLKRSRMSADQKRSNNQYHRTLYSPYQHDTHSLTNSRASNQFLCQPIISHNNMGQPGRKMFQQLPSFKKTNTKQFYQFNITKPVLKNQQNPYYAQKSMFGQGDHKSPLSFQTQNPIKTITKQQSSQNFDQFLDMDFYSKQNKKPSMEQIRSSTESKDFFDQQPISPVNPVRKQISQKMEPVFLQSEQAKYAKQTSKPTIDHQIRSVLDKVDKQGKLITIFLVGLGIILVIYQAIR